MQALDFFFAHLYPIPVFSILHQATVMESHHTGELDRTLCFALIGLVTSLSDVSLGPAEFYVDTAEKLVLGSMENPTWAQLQAMILIIKFRENCRRFASVFMLMAVAVRHLTALRLNYEHERLTFTRRETLRRVAWSLFMIDSHLAGGYRDFALLPSDMMHIRLPCHEPAFQTGGSELPSYLRPRNVTDSADDTPHALNALALVVKLRWLRHRILAFTKTVLAHSTDAPLHQQIQALQQELNDFMANLPEGFEFNERSARLQAYSPTFAAFAMIHIIWHGAHLILFRLALTGMKEALAERSNALIGDNLVYQYRNECSRHATMLGKALDCLREAKPTPMIFDMDIAVGVYQCLRVLFCLYHLRFPGVSLEDLQAHAQSCLSFVQCSSPKCKALIFIASLPPSSFVRSMTSQLTESRQNHDM